MSVYADTTMKRLMSVESDVPNNTAPPKVEIHKHPTFLRIAIAILTVVSAVLISVDVTVSYSMAVDNKGGDKDKVPAHVRKEHFTYKLDHTNIEHWPLGNVDSLGVQYFTFAVCIVVAILELVSVFFRTAGVLNVGPVDTAKPALGFTMDCFGGRGFIWVINVLLFCAVAVSIAMVVVFRHMYEFDVLGAKTTGLPVTWVAATVALCVAELLGIIDGVTVVVVRRNDRDGVEEVLVQAE